MDHTNLVIFPVNMSRKNKEEENIPKQIKSNFFLVKLLDILLIDIYLDYPKDNLG